MDMEHKETAEINPTENEEVAAPIPVDVDEFVVQVLRKCDCASLAKYFKGIKKEQFLRFTLQDIDRFLPTPVATSFKIYEEITNTSTVSAQRQEFQLNDLTLKSVSSFEPNSENCNSSRTNCQTNDDGELQFSFTPKKIKLVDYESSDSDDIEEGEDVHQKKGLCRHDQQTSNLVVGVSESPAPACSPTAINGKTTEMTQNRIITGPLNAAKDEKANCNEIREQVTCGNLTQSDQNDDVIVQIENLECIMSSIAEDDNDEVVIEVAEHPPPISISLMRPSASTTSSASANSTLRDSLLQNRFSFVQTDTDKFIEVRSPSIHTDRLKKPKYGNLYAKEICTKISLLLKEVVSKKHRDCSEHQSPRESKEWIEFYKKIGPNITSVKLNTWSWGHLDSKCPFNIFKILRQDCPNLEELIFNVGPHEVGLDFKKVSSSGWLQFQQLGNLPSLRKIVVHVKHAMNSKKVSVLVLQKILQASPNLEELSYEFRCYADARKVLTTLSGFDSEVWDKLKILRILYVGLGLNSGRFCKKDMKLFKGVKAKNLQEIYLTLDILIDVDSEEDFIEAIFLNFPFLKKFVLNGAYFTDCSASDEDFVLKIPASSHLEHLENGFCTFIPVIEEPSSLIAHNDRRPGPGQTRRMARTRRVTAVKKLELAVVGVAIPHLMPKLKTIILDEYVEINDLHFTSIPQIATFRVESEWNLSAKFPSENCSKNCFPFLTELQIPNYLEDECFLLSLPQRFPNLTKCWISVPSVKVLRAFFKTMADSKLETIILCTRFYFESSLQVCFFGGLRMTDRQLGDERKKWDKLRKYGMFQKFIDWNMVEWPCWEIIDELRDNEKYAELSALKHLKNLEMEHVPVVLRIPKGDADWKGPEAEFTQSCVGFKKYPLSKSFIDQLPSRMHFSKGSNFEIVEQEEDRDNSNDAGAWQINRFRKKLKRADKTHTTLQLIDSTQS